MRNGSNKKVVGLLFLLAFLFLRVANAHTLSHFADDTNEDHCELCEIICVSQELTPFADPGPSETPNFSLVYPKIDDVNAGYDEPLHCFASPTFVYNKPPPGL